MIATGAYLGGVRLTRASWVGGALRVRFESVHSTCLHQLYAGRQKLGETSAVGQRVLVVLLEPSTWPARLTVVAVEPAQAGQDFGDLLPERAYNRPRLTFTASGGTWSEAKTIEVLSGAEPGDPIGDGVERGRMVFEAEGSQSIRLKPLPGSGFWGLRIQGRDGRLPSGNVGTAAETVVRVVSHPPDLVAVAGSGLGTAPRRFTVSVAGGVATIGCEVP